jgi:hypothetical protein
LQSGKQNQVQHGIAKILCIKFDSPDGRCLQQVQSNVSGHGHKKEANRPDLPESTGHPVKVKQGSQGQDKLGQKIQGILVEVESIQGGHNHKPVWDSR